jgi:hypothetical protein
MAIGFSISCSSGPSFEPEAIDLNSLAVATCPPETVVTATAVIGSAGGTLTAGLNSLVVPAHALQDSVEITMTVGGDSTRSASFLPEGLQFQSNRPSTLTLAYTGCEFPEDSVGNPAGHIPANAGIAYVGIDQTILEFQLGTIDTAANTISSQLRHFSRYAVAW